MVPLYPPVTKLPPAAMISVKPPPTSAISRTPPSKPPSTLKLCRNVISTGATGRSGTGIGIPKGSVSRLESVTQLGSLWNAAFGGESGMVATVVQLVTWVQVPVGMQLAGPGINAVSHPCGRVGGRTPSKFSENVKHPVGACPSNRALAASGARPKNVTTAQMTSEREQRVRAGSLDAIPLFTSDSSFQPAQVYDRNWDCVKRLPVPNIRGLDVG